MVLRVLENEKYCGHGEREKKRYQNRPLGETLGTTTETFSDVKPARMERGGPLRLTGP